MSTFTIKQVMPTGEESPTYGKEFFVQFSEMEDTVKLWFKKETPEPGTTVDLEKGPKGWKKVKKEFKPNTSNAAAPATGKATAPSRAPYKDNSLGMRIGMCINNAAQYVNTLEFEKALTDREWATTVASYAKALFAVSGDENFTAPSEEDAVKSVQDVFGPGATEVK